MEPKRTFRKLVKNLKLDFGTRVKITLALLGDTSTQFLAKVIRACGYDDQLNLEVWQSDYDQIDLQLNNVDSEYYGKDHDYTIIFKSAQKLIKTYYVSKKKNSLAEFFIDKMAQHIESINQRKKTRIIIFNLVEIPDQIYNNFGNRYEGSWIYQLRKINIDLMDLARGYDNVYICDLSIIQNRLGRETFLDPVNFTRSDATIGLKALPAVGRSVCDIVAAGTGKFNKCLILDLDHTMWGGIIGDDGIENIQIGSLGIGKVFSEIQLWAKTLKNRGVILCICSKNTESVAKEPFERHPDMILRLDDIAVFMANWESKSDNIRHIQAILNIGFDSMVFLDDNPFERNLVRTELPEVTVPELPKDPVYYLPYLEQFNLFETLTVSSLDKDRTKQYQTEAKRVVFHKAQGSLEEYLKNLKMEARVSAFDNFHVPRISQLTQRSNQFNLRTIRYDEAEIKTLINSENHITRYIALGDKFGDYGLIGLLVLEKLNEEQAFIDTWIMSCRVLKRNVEALALNELVKTCHEQGFSTLIGERLPTKKNVLVEHHYENLGFLEGDDGRWYLDLENYEEKEHFIKKLT